MDLYKKFLGNFIRIALAISIAIAALCAVADPYEVWHIYARQGFNLYSVKGELIERLTKPLNFILHQTDSQAVILGSSRADFALSPKLWEDLTGRKTYNFAVTSAITYEMRRYVEFAAANDKNLQEIILCVDFFAFVDNPSHDILKIIPYTDEKNFEDSLPSLENLQKILFSWNAIKDSFTNCRYNLEQSPDFLCHDLDGKFSEKYIVYHYNKPNSSFMGILDSWNNSIDFSTVALKDTAFKDFQKIVELCAAKNIKLYVCILPLYPLHYSAFDDCRSLYDEWKVRLTSIVPVYDFTCFDEDLIRAENFWDTSHIKLFIGDKILRSIHSGNLEFGEILTPENVRLHNQNISRQLEIWRKNNQ